MQTAPRNTQLEVASLNAAATFEQQQRRRMLFALAVLLVALIFVLIKDWRSLEPPVPAASDTELSQPATPEATSPAPEKSIPAPSVPANQAERRKSRTATHKLSTAARSQASSPVLPVIAATNRAVLPPLQVEVVAGDQHRAVSTADPSVNVEMRSGTTAFSQPAQQSSAESAPATVPSNAAERVQLSPGTAQIVSRPVDPSYPLLAKQMKVQGAVILQALISKTGSIQEIQVLSGPAILSAAAREAVRQWKFKPYLQSGRAVETEARITVNFTISTY
jgi:protein TonB